MEQNKSVNALLRIKECDLRQDTWRQFAGAVDKGGHIGGAFSAIAPLTALYYGDILQYDVVNPTSTRQDVFLLSKGHAVAALATVLADVGYFPQEQLWASRGWGDLIKGHPGPVIPGVPVATGPLGHGISLGCGFAAQGKEKGTHDVYVLAGDGELQEGSNWEGLMYAGDKQLNNLCVIIDKNNGQSDDTQQLLLSSANLAEQLFSFGFQVLEADGTDVGSILAALQGFRQERGTQPTAIIVESVKGFGGYGALTGKHKSNFTDEDIASELALLAQTRQDRVALLNRCDRDELTQAADAMGYDLAVTDNCVTVIVARPVSCQVQPAQPRNPALSYDPATIPALDPAKVYGTSDIATMMMKAFAADTRLYTIDSDLSNISGLFTGTAATNRAHAINAGIAEAHMMNMAEGLAAMGNHVWVSTFGVFFDWQVFRRIAVSYQERLEVIEQEGGWLTEGHNLDITFYSTASNLDTAVNGATHMDNDDINFFLQLAHVKVIDVCCPQQLLSVGKWIAQGGKGLVYLRVMRNPSPILYPADYEFAYGKATMLRQANNAKAVIVSSGHGVLEALEAADLLAKDGIAVSVLDMPSYDSETLRALAASGVNIIFAEQNNGAWFDLFSRDLLANRFACNLNKVHQLSTKNADGTLRFIQSGTYGQLVKELGLSAGCIANLVRGL